MQRKKYKKIFPILLFIATLFMGIGYASINGVTLDITGLLSAQSEDGIFITNINYLSAVDAEATNNEMTIDYQTLLNNKIVLSDTNKDSSITYQITVYNSTNDTYAFYDTLYSTDEFFYDNSDIVFTTSGINKWDEIDSRESITFTITFQYKDAIRKEIESITENELNSLINFKFGRYYNINYRYIDNNNYPTRIFEGENLNVTFVNDIPDYVEVAGSDIFVYENPNLVIPNVENDITITGNILFKQATYTFNGTSDILNTGVAVFSDENVNKNFEISFEISAYGNNQDFSTIINAMDENGNGWPGFLIRLQNNENALRLYYDSNGPGGSEHKQFYSYAGINKVQIVRIDNVVYYRFNDGEYIETVDYTAVNTFDTPVTFGASLDANGNPFRFFQGTLTNMVVKFLEDDYQLEDNPEKSYIYEGQYQFNGTTDYIDTQMYLFNDENKDKNFEISFEITQNNANVSFNTLVSIMDETGAPYPGITLRYWGEDFQLSANIDENNNKEYIFPNANVGKIKLVKVDGVLYLIVDENEPVYIIDYSGFNGALNVPVTFGASLDGNGNPWRYFNGILSDMSVKFIQNNITINDYVALYG